MWENNSTYQDYECYLKQRNYQINDDLLKEYANSYDLSYELSPANDLDFDNNYMMPFISPNNKEVHIFFKPTGEYKKYIEQMLILHSDKPDYKLQVDPNKCTVIRVEVESYIYGNMLTESNGKRCIALVNPEYDEYYNNGRHYSLTLFDRAINFQNMKYIEYLTLGISKFSNFLNFVNDTLYPILEKADYTCEYVTMNKPIIKLETLENLEDLDEYSIIFEHPSSQYINANLFWIQLDPFTFDIHVINDLDIFNKNKDELYDYLLENYWKPIDKQDMEYKMSDIGPFSYLYNNKLNKNSYVNYMHKVIENTNNQRRVNAINRMI
jgi:hypothetical protein